jgi:TonB family protein
VYSDSGRRAFTRQALFILLTAAVQTVRAGDEPAKDNRDRKESGKDSTQDPVYQPGGEVKSPKLVHYVEPSFSSSSKEAFVEGVVRISTVVTIEGHPADLHVLSGLNTEEDRTAVEAVTQWRFQPGSKNGKPVNVRVTVEVEFHLL